MNNAISLENLSRAMRLGKLGEQVVMRSEKAFNALKFLTAEPVRNEHYYPKKVTRDRAAREEYRKIRYQSNPIEDVYMIDIIRERWQNEDECLR